MLRPTEWEKNIVNQDYITQFRNFITQYEPFSDEEFDRISSLFHVRSVAKSIEIIKQGEHCKQLWFVISGTFRAFNINPNGIDSTTDFAFENQFMTSFKSYVTNSPSTDSVIALEESILLEARLDLVQDIQNKIPSFKNAVLKIIEFAFICMEERNFALQNLSAEKRYEDLLENGDSRILQRIPLLHIASYLGISPETLSRARKKIISW